MRIAVAIMRLAVSRSMVFTLPLWHFAQQASQALRGRADIQALLNFPCLRRQVMHHGDAKVAFERFDDVQRAPRRTQNVDCLRLAMREEHLLDEAIDLGARERLNLVE